MRAYAAAAGLHRIDSLHRSLEALCATLDDEPVAEAAIAKIRSGYADILRRMADAFTRTLETGGWSVGGCQRQADTFTRVEQSSGDPVAFFLVDAFRLRDGAGARSQPGRGGRIVRGACRRSAADDHPRRDGGAHAGGLCRFLGGGRHGRVGVPDWRCGTQELGRSVEAVGRPWCRESRSSISTEFCV